MEKIQNWDDIQESSFIDAEGKYTLKVVDVLKADDGGYTQVSPNGNEFHKYVCETKEKQRINVTLFLKETTLWKYKSFVGACGVPTTGTVNFETLPETLIGRKFIGEVKRQPDRINVETGLPEQSKFFEVTKFYKIEE